MNISNSLSPSSSGMLPGGSLRSLTRRSFCFRASSSSHWLEQNAPTPTIPLVAGLPQTSHFMALPSGADDLDLFPDLEADELDRPLGSNGQLARSFLKRFYPGEVRAYHRHPAVGSHERGNSFIAAALIGDEGIHLVDSGHDYPPVISSLIPLKRAPIESSSAW